MPSVPEEAHSLPIRRSHRGTMFKKIVQRVPVGAADPVSDLIALIDLIDLIKLGSRRVAKVCATVSPRSSVKFADRKV